MTQWEEAALANLLLHEMTHVTLYFKDQTDFNEQVATFIGNQGAIDFLIEKYGIGSPQVVEAIHSQEDDLLFSRWIDQAYRRLSNFYSKEISREEKIKGREEIFHSLREEFKEITFKIDWSKNFDKIELNNAVLLAYRRYIHRLEKFQILYETLGNDLRRMVDFFKRDPSLEGRSFFLFRAMDEREKRYRSRFPSINSSTMALASLSGIWTIGCFIA